jgi:hypothetical protein
MGGILLLALVVTGLGVLVGWTSPQRLTRFCVWLAVGPVLIGLAYSAGLSAYRGLPVLAQLALIALLPFALLLVAHALLPKSPWAKHLTNAMFDAILFALTFPVRLVWRSVRLVASREHQPARLERHRPVVGHRPPVRARARRDSEEY